MVSLPTHLALPLPSMPLKVRDVRVAQERHDVTDGDLGHGGGAGGGVGDGDAALPGGEKVDVVESDANA